MANLIGNRLAALSLSSSRFNHHNLCIWLDATLGLSKGFTDFSTFENGKSHDFRMDVGKLALDFNLHWKYPGL
jgi:hypothetical protein